MGALSMIFSDCFSTLNIHSSITQGLKGRALPDENEYWKKRKEYISPSPGYYFIPVFFDLLHRQGIAYNDLLSETHLTAIEEILDSVARFERAQFDHEKHLINCRNSLLKRGFPESKLHEIERSLVFKSFDKIPPHFTALARANTFLYATALVSTDYELILKTWVSFMPLILFLDDVEDLAKDKAANDENCLLQGVSPEESFFALHPILSNLLQTLHPINLAAFKHFDNLRQLALKKAMIEISLLD
jgi:hypothetical protein